MPGVNPLVMNVAITELPAVVEFFKGLFRKAHPEAVQPTSEEVIAAFHDAVQSSLAKDDAWRQAHPTDV